MKSTNNIGLMYYAQKESVDNVLRRAAYNSNTLSDKDMISYAYWGVVPFGRIADRLSLDNDFIRSKRLLISRANYDILISLGYKDGVYIVKKLSSYTWR